MMSQVTRTMKNDMCGGAILSIPSFNTYIVLIGGCKLYTILIMFCVLGTIVQDLLRHVYLFCPKHQFVLVLDRLDNDSN